jgi:hypothetical protein
LGWKLDLIILSKMLHVPWDVGFKQRATLDYLPLFPTRNNSALESAISKYSLLVTHFHLQMFDPTSALRIFYPNEPTVSVSESYMTLRRDYKTLGVCPVAVIGALESEPEYETPPHIVLWHQFDVAWYARKRLTSPRRDSVFLSSCRIFPRISRDLVLRLEREDPGNGEDIPTDDSSPAFLKAGERAALAALRRDLDAHGLRQLRILVGAGRTTAEHLQEIGQAFVVLALDNSISTGQVIAEAMLMGTLVIGETPQTAGQPFVTHIQGRQCLQLAVDGTQACSSWFAFVSANSSKSCQV